MALDELVAMALEELVAMALDELEAGGAEAAGAAAVARAPLRPWPPSRRGRDTGAGASEGSEGSATGAWRPGSPPGSMARGHRAAGSERSCLLTAAGVDVAQFPPDTTSSTPAPARAPPATREQAARQPVPPVAVSAMPGI